MITSKEEYDVCLKNLSDKIFIWPVLEDGDFIHPATSRISVVFVKDIITNQTHTFSFSHPDCLYFINKTNFEDQIKKYGYIWCLNKQCVSNHLSIFNLIDVNLYLHLNHNWIVDLNSYETNAHKLIKRNGQKIKSINNIIPLLKHQEMFENIYNEVKIKTNSFSTDITGWNGFIKENNLILDTLEELETIGIHVNRECFQRHHPNVKIYNNDLVYSQYNIYTSTGRPSNRFDGVNYAALNKSTGIRKCFTSRYGDDGKMILIDYSAFHPRIISYLTKFPIDIKTDIYEYLGELYLNRKTTEYDIDEIKRITMRQLYGGVEEKYKHIKYLNGISDFINSYWEDWLKNDYVETPIFKRIISSKHLVDANPYKLLNYILQATETEISISTLKLVLNYLRNKKTKPVLYTYDSILFDFNKNDGNETLEKIVEIMKINNKFPIKVYEGKNYDELKQIF